MRLTILVLPGSGVGPDVTAETVCSAGVAGRPGAVAPPAEAPQR